MPRYATNRRPSTEYDWLPMHRPGSVQDYGVLLVAEPQTRRVVYVSSNAADMFGIPAADIINKSYLTLCDHERQRKSLVEIDADTILFPNPLRMTIKGRDYDAVFHSHEKMHHIELEPVLDVNTDYAEMSLRATAELYDPPSVDELYQRAVRTIHEVSGYDRVMLYRFDSRNNGQVLAEAKRDGIGSFLGLFFPSGDIPARARELYLNNFTRYIPNINGKKYPLVSVFPGVGQPDGGHPLDMSFTNLRSVYDCHIDYLRNIGVQASMSFSIVVDGKLWGLFACHHYTPRVVSYDQRVVCEQTAMMFIYRLVTMSSVAARLAQRHEELSVLSQSLNVAATLRRRLAGLKSDWRATPDADVAQSMLSRAIEAVEAETGFLLSRDAPPPEKANEELTEAQRVLLNLVEADSAAIVRHGRVSRIGNAPSEMAVYAISSMFGRELPDLQTGDLHIYATDCLAAHVPVTEAVKDKAAGVLAVALSFDTPAYLLWFRQEQVVHATWAGNPSAEAMSPGAQGLNPRASFEAWKQDIRNLSRSWLLEDVQIADELATVLRGLETGSGVQHSGAVSFVAQPIPLRPYEAPAPAPSGIGATPPRRVIRIGQR